jgi:tetratricopeptide (TPR) repeat protein
MAITTQIQLKKSMLAAEGYLMLEMPAQALLKLELIPECDDRCFEFYTLKAEAYRMIKDHPQALDAFHSAYAVNPTDVSTLLGMAWCYKRVDQLESAISIMHQAYKVSPKQPLVLYNLSCYYALDGNKEEALHWLVRSLRLDSSLRKLVDDETDFDQLRDDQDFQFIINTKS